jgi:hypothetical protein
MNPDEEMTSQPSTPTLFNKPGPKSSGLNLFGKNRPQGFLFKQASESDMSSAGSGTPKFLQRMKHRNPFALTPDANVQDEAKEVELPEVSTPTPNAVVKNLSPSLSAKISVKPLMIDFKSSLTSNTQVTPKSSHIDKDLWTDTPMSSGSLGSLQMSFDVISSDATSFAKKTVTWYRLNCSL